jgi:acyl dehydratase
MSASSIRYAEDYRVGESIAVGEHVVTKEEIISFARTWDPQPFHIDEEFAAKTIYGGVIASGWHVALIMFRMVLSKRFVSPEAGLGSPGHEGLKWLKPVRPGDRLIGKIEVADVRISRSKPDIGFVTTVSTLKNQHGEDVYWLKSVSIIRSRASATQS